MTREQIDMLIEAIVALRKLKPVDEYDIGYNLGIADAWRAMNLAAVEIGEETT